MTEIELYHYGIKGQKWGVRREKQKNRVRSLKTTNERISSDFRKSKGRSDSYEKTMAYAGNKLSQAYLRKNDRATMHEDINNPSKNRGLSIGKAYVKTFLKDLGVSAIPASAVAVGTTFLTGNPLLGMTVGNFTSQGVQFGIVGTRIYNMVNNT